MIKIVFTNFIAKVQKNKSLIKEGIMRSAIFKDGKFENYLMMIVLKAEAGQAKLKI